MNSRSLAPGTPARLVLHTAQASLFDTADALPAGLVFAPDFIDTGAERALLDLAAALPLHEAQYKDYTARRRVFAYGTQLGQDDARYERSPRQLAALDALPAALHSLRKRLAAWAGVGAQELVHVMVAEYQTGTPLGWHRDAPHYELIAGVSLGSAARLRLRPWPPQGAKRDATVALDLAPRSAYLLRGEARWGWQHSVPPVPALRYSVTMRTARTG